MAQVITYNQVVEILRSIAQRHYQINTFFLGKNWELENNEDIVYPVLQVYPELARMPQRNGQFSTVEVRLVCKVIDLVSQDESNEKDVHSDTLRISQDIVNELNQHPYYQRSNANIIGDIDFTNLEEFEDDFTAGWEFDLILQLVNNNTFCGLPMEDIEGFSALGPDFSAVTYNTQYLDCSTVTGCTTLQDYITTEIQNSSSSVWSGGSVVNNSTFLGDLTVNGDTVVNNLTGDTATFDNYISGGTSLEQVINNLIDGAEDITRVQPGVNTYTGGTGNLPTVNIVDSPSFNNLTFSGTATGGNLSVNGLSATTIYSAGTNLNTIITTIAQDQGDKTRVQPGTNINTGGTANFPVVNLNDNISVTSVSAATIYSGSTNLYNIFATTDSNDITRVQPGSNITTGGTENNPIVNLSASPSVNSLTFSGSVVGPAISATTISGGTILSGSTNLTSIFAPVDLITNPTNDRVLTSLGTSNTANAEANLRFNGNTLTIIGQSTGGTLSDVAALSVAGYGSFSQNIYSFSAGTADRYVLAGASDPVGNFRYAGIRYDRANNVAKFGNYFNVLGEAGYIAITSGGTVGIGTTNPQARFHVNNITTGATVLFEDSTNPDFTPFIIDTNGLVGVGIFNPTERLQVSGNTTISGTLTVSGITSGTSETRVLVSDTTGQIKYISSSALTAGSSATLIQNGLNTYTGGTSNLPTVNISAATLNNLTVSGNTVLAVTSATTISVLNNTTATTTFTDYNGNAIESGTSLSNIVGGQNNRITSGKNNIQIIGGNGITGTTDGTTYTNNLDVRGALLSGGTNLYSIFATSDTNDITRVQPGSNITTGGTANNPTVSLAASPSINGLSFSGTATGVALSATTLSGGTILSGGTNLYSIFIPQTALFPYDFMAAASDETTAITTGTNKITFYAPRTFTLTGVTATLTTTGSTTTTVDVNYNGSSVFSTPISLASGVFYATTATTTSSISKYGKFTVDIDAAGTSAAGLKIILEGRTTI
jgi:hypothetical protein